MEAEVKPCKECMVVKPLTDFYRQPATKDRRTGRCRMCILAERRTPVWRAKRKATRTPERMAWENMRQRCLDSNHPSYRFYGGRGIAICSRWDSFDTFLADMGSRPTGLSLERRDNNGSYEPNNCYWATWSEQQRNRRRSRPWPNDPDPL